MKRREVTKPVMSTTTMTTTTRMAKQSHRRPRRRTLLGACAAAAAAALLAAPRTTSAVEEVIYDLRVVGGADVKAATVSIGAPTVNLALFAYVLDLNANPADTGFNSAQGAWMSSGGGLLGNFTTALSSPYDAAAAQNPAPADLDNDGDLDVGNVASASAGFWIASSGASGNFTSGGTEIIGGQTYRAFQLGTGTFSLTSFSGGTTTQLNFVPRTGDALIKPHKYFKDSTSTLTSINGNDSLGRLGVASSVNITLGGDNYTWTRAAGTGDWDNPGNWSIPAVPNSTRDSVTFGNTGAGQSVQLNGNRTVAAINFANTTGSYAFNAGVPAATLLLHDGTGVGTVTHSGSASVVFNPGLTVSAGTLNVNTTTAPSFITVGGALNANTVSKLGAGTLALGSTAGVVNNFNVNAGVLRVTAPQPVQNSTFTLSGGTLELRANASTVFGRPVVVTANSTIWTSLNGIGPTDGVHSLGSLSIGNQTLTVTGANGYDLSFTGPVTLTAGGAPATFNVIGNNSHLHLAGAISGDGGIIKSGAHGLYLEGTQPNNYTGFTVVTEGTLLLNKPAGVNAVGGNVIVNNSGRIDWLASEQIPDSATLTLNAGGSLFLGGHTETIAQFVDNGGNVTLGGGQLVVTGGDVILNDGTTIATDVSLGRDLIYTGTTTTATVTGAIALAANNVNHIFNIADGADAVDVSITGPISGATNIVKTGDGTLGYDGPSANTYTGATTVSAGTLSLAKFGVTSIVGPLEVNGTGTVRLHNANQIGDAVPVMLNGTGVLDLNGRSETIGSLGGAGGTIELDGGDLTVNQAATASFAGVLAGTGGIVKSGLATLTLAGANTFTGGVTIQQGALRVAADANLGAAAQVQVDHGATLAATASFVTAKNLVLDPAPGAGATIEVAPGATLGLSGNITGSSGGSGLLRKTGGGTLDVTGPAGAINADLVIDAGAIALSGGRTLASGVDVTVNASGVFDLSNATQPQIARTLSGDGSVVVGAAGTTFVVTPPAATTSSFAGAMTGAGSLRADGAGTLLLGGVGTIGEKLEVTNGTLAVGSAGSVTANVVEVNAGSGSATLDIAGHASAVTDVLLQGNNPGGAVANVQAGGSLAAGGNIQLGDFTQGSATLNLPAGATVIAGGSVLVLNGSTVNLSGGTIIAGTFGGDPAATWKNGFNWTAGTLRITEALSLNASNGELGPHYTVGANRTLEAADLTVSDLSAASLTIAGGGTLRSLPSPNGARIGVSTGGSALVHVTGTGSTWTLEAGVPLAITGDSGPGTLQIDNGGSVIALGGNISVVGVQSGSAGISVAGGGGLSTAGSVSLDAVDAASIASLTVGAGGEVNVGATLTTARRGNVTVNGGGVLTANALTLDAGDATVFAVSAQGGAVINVGAGGITSAGGYIDLVRHPTTPGRLLLGGDFTYNGTSRQANIASTGEPGGLVGVIDLLGGQRTFNVGAGAASTDVSVQAKLVNGGITKTGAGSMSLVAAADYAGPTDIQQGEFIALFGALPASSPVTVASGAVLRLTHDQTLASLAGSGAVFFNGTTLTLGDEGNTAFNGTLDGAGPTPTGKLVKKGTGTFDLGSDVTGVDQITVNLGTLRLSGVNGALGGVVNVAGTGPTQGTLALTGDNLGAASLNLTGGRVRYENAATVTRSITLGVGGGTFDADAPVTLNTILGGPGGLTKGGPASLAIGMPATYDGQTNIMAGTLQSQVAHAIPGSSEIFINTGATLALGANDQALASITGGGAITMAGATLALGGNDATTLFTGSISGSGTMIKNGSGAITLAGPIELVAPVDVNAGTIVFAGNNTSTGGITVAGGGMVSVAAAGKLGASSNTVTLDGGTLRATGSFTSANPIGISAAGGTIDVTAAHTLTQAGAVNGSGPLIKSGTGTLRLGSEWGVTNKVRVRGGTMFVTDGGLLLGATGINVDTGATLTLDNAALDIGDRLADSATLKLAGGTFDFRGKPDGSGESIGTLHLAPGQSTIAATSGSAALAFLAPTTIDPGAALNFNATTPGSAQKLLLAGIADGPTGAWATVTVASDTRFAKYDAVQGLIPLADEEYAVNAFVTDANVRMDRFIHNAESTNIRTLTMDGSILGIDPGRAISISTGGIIFNGQSSEINGPVGDTGSITSGAGMLHVRVDGDPAAIHAKISGAIGLTKSGAGSLELGNNLNDFAGDVYLNGGSLRVSDDRQLGVSAPDTPNGNDIVFNGGTLWAIPAADLAISAGRQLHFNGGGGRLLVAGSGVAISLNHDEQLAGDGAMTKDGSGTLRIAGANSYQGLVTVAGGHLELSHRNALGGGVLKDEGRSLITLSAGTFLDLRSDGPFPADFGNDIEVLDTPDDQPATITTGVRTDGVAGQFQLNNLNIGKATLATGGTSGSLAFTGIVTLTGGESRFDAGRDLVFADRVTGGGALTKLGSGTLTLGSGDLDTAANTYAGVTNIAGGVLELNKAAGTVAIPGDIIMSGGTLVLRQPRQIADNSAVLLTGGTFDLGGQSDSIQTLNNAGADVVVNGGTLTIGSTTISSGTITIGAPRTVPAAGGGGGGGAPGLPSANDTISSAIVSNDYHVDGALGATIVNPGGSLEVGSTGLFFEGGGTPQITLVNDPTQPGKLLLRGNVTVVAGTTGGAIASSTATPLLGVIDMGDVTRIFFVTDADSNLTINGKVTRGGIRKENAGKLTLAAANDHTLGTVVAGGTVEAYDGALGSGVVTLSGGNLNLRSDAGIPNFVNDVVASSTTINIDRISGGGEPAGAFRLGKLTIGASRLRAVGANGGSLEFTGAVLLTGSSAPTSGATVIENFVPVTLSNAITGTGKLTKDTGTATLTLSGASANTYAGATRVNTGTLQLNKSAAVTAIPGNLEAFTGGQVLWMNNDQVADTATLSVNSVNAAPTRLDLGDFHDTVAALELSAGTIATRTNGLLRINGGITSYPNTSSATISGNIELTAGMHVVHTTNIPKPTPQVPNPAPQANTAADDLIISANISGLGGITKTGSETLVLSGSNSFTGGLVVQGGTLRNTGATQFTGNASLDVGTTLDLPGNFSTAPGAVVTKSGVGSLIIGGPQSHGAGAQLVVQQGALNMNTDAGGPATRTLAINATGGAVQFGNAQHLASLTVGDGVTATVTPGGNKVIVTDNLTATGSGTIDINDNHLVVNNGSVGVFDGVAYTGLTRKIADAYNFASWDGPGIRTGMPAATEQQLTTIAIVTAEEIYGGEGVFAGHTVSASAVILAYTYAGDSNLDGLVDAADYGVIDNWVQFPGSYGYAKGDFNFDGVVDASDYGIIDNTIQLQGAPFPLTSASAPFAASSTAATTSSAALNGVSAVPEPSAACGFAVLAAVGGILGRRRRRRMSQPIVCRR